MKNYNRLNILIILLLLFSEITLSSPNEYNAIYVFYKSGIEFAESEHEMIYDKDLKQWCLYTSSNTSGLFSLKKDLRRENSCFENNIPENTSHKNIGKYLVTMMYSFERKKSNYASKISSIKIKKNLVTSVNDQDIIHDKNIRIDRLIAQIFGYSLTKVKVSDKGRERVYKFNKISEENIKTVLGNIPTLVIKKEIEGSKRSTLTWYSVNHNFLPVRIEQYRLNKHMFTAVIKEYSK